MTITFHGTVYAVTTEAALLALVANLSKRAA